MRPRVLTLVFAALMLVSLQSGSASPVRDVSPRKHPNLAAAQDLCQKAYNRIVQAQKANEWDMGGHAQKAKELLDQVNIELKAAALTANENKQ